VVSPGPEGQVTADRVDLRAARVGIVLLPHRRRPGLSARVRVGVDWPVVRARTYIIYCAWACVSPVALALLRIAFGAPASVPAQDDLMFALLGTFMAGLFTYPSGVVGTIVSCAAVYGIHLKPTESVLLAAPLYVAAGYFQWYVLIPRYFRGGADGTLISRRRRTG